MRTLEQAFRENWRRLFNGDDRPVLLALSGGMDSMSLAKLLTLCGISFAAAHCNFGLRGEDSDTDEATLKDWAAKAGIALFIRRFDMQKLSESGNSVQMTARNLRYEWFSVLLKAHGFSALLTAHHADDLAETLLINLMRGAGIAGLQGIPERNGDVVRPLLFATRAELYRFAIDNMVSWREDTSNQTDKYLRNALRHNILPALDRLAPGAACRIAAAGRRVAGAYPLYRGEMDKIIKRLMEPRGRDFYIPLRLLGKQASLDNVIFELFSSYGFGSDQVPQIRALMESGSGKQLQSDTHRLLRDREFLILTALETGQADLIPVSANDHAIVTKTGELHIRRMPLPQELPADPAIALLDARDISFPLTLRTRREGDYFYPLGMGGKKKKLKRYLVDVKMPVSEKARVMILEQQGKILWIVGSRIDERFKIRHDTTEVLELRWLRSE